MRLVHAEESRADRNIVGKIQVRGADAAGKRAAQRSLQAAGAEGQEGFRIGEEETGGNFVLAAVEFPVPVGGELIVGIFPGLTIMKGAVA